MRGSVRQEARIAAPTKAAAILARPLALPCGVVLRNRLVKSAMSDSLGDGAGNPTRDQACLYQRWARGGAAAAIVGEVQTDPFALEKPGNLVLAPDSDPEPFSRLTGCGRENHGHIWAQLGHAGALAYAPLGRPRGPSAIDMPGLSCAQMTAGEIRDIPALFAAGAERAKAAGFTGVQIHAAHGFLLSQFLSPLFNRRTDDWGGALPRRVRLLMESIEAVRAAVGAGFPVALKMNCTDRLEGGLHEEDAAELVGLIDATSIDLVEVSGGTYFPGAKPAGGGRGGGPYFVDFARGLRSRTSKPLMATGGFKSLAQVADALESGAVDFVGLARAFVMDPDLPGKWIPGSGPDPHFPRFAATTPGAVTAWYTMRIAMLAEGREDGFADSAEKALDRYERRDAARHESWRARFGNP
ncbi:oxidoreductase [Oricola nitratireducens]|uniref:oxidoreductase n=1 Tax=Oricola nitratireducens TaxID=2775868 RepID=UPI001866DA98|nr:oxidoreductase [Oricola nitratireducens]